MALGSAICCHGSGRRKYTRALDMCHTVVELRRPFRRGRFRHSDLGQCAKCLRAPDQRRRTCNDTRYYFPYPGIYGGGRHACDWLLTAIGALVLLVAAAISVNAQASRWLKPLPIRSGTLALRTLIPTFAFMLCATAIESWLLWVLRSPVARCIGIGAFTLMTSTVFTFAGSLLAIHGRNKGPQ